MRITFLSFFVGDERIGDVSWVVDADFWMIKVTSRNHSVRNVAEGIGSVDPARALYFDISRMPR